LVQDNDNDKQSNCQEVCTAKVKRGTKLERNGIMADTLGTRIMKLRGEKETQQQLADALGVSRSLVKAWENDDRPVTSDHLVKLASHYGKSCDYLLGLIGEDNATNDEKLRAVSEYTGLSNDAIQSIADFKLYDHNAHLALNYLLESPSYWMQIAFDILLAVSALRISKDGSTDSSVAEHLTIAQDAISRIGEGNGFIMIGEEPLNIPKGNVLLSGYDACDFYKAKAEKYFSEFLDALIEDASSKSFGEA
jgi:transcriptional regulator with XRE-family HTH domain